MQYRNIIYYIVIVSLKENKHKKSLFRDTPVNVFPMCTYYVLLCVPPLTSLHGLQQSCACRDKTPFLDHTHMFFEQLHQSPNVIHINEYVNHFNVLYLMQ